jgi:hypothetical protein
MKPEKKQRETQAITLTNPLALATVAIHYMRSRCKGRIHVGTIGQRAGDGVNPTHQAMWKAPL